VALAASCAAQLASREVRLRRRSAEAAGLGLLAIGLTGVVVASPLRSLTVLLVASITIGVGHGLGFLNAQDELNALAPPERRGEVTSAFISCIYAVVAFSVIGSGLLDRWLSLSLAVGAVAVTLAAGALLTAVWQLAHGGRTR
jgi:hypothetical protein